MCGTNSEIINSDPTYGLVIHAGAGNIVKENMPDSLIVRYKEKLNEALDVGIEILRKGGKSTDAVEATIHVLEDTPLFNSGKGSVFNHDGVNEMDASIMDGKTLNAGAVSGVRTVKNPISAALMVMQRSEHVMLSGRGADEFAADQGLIIVDKSYFYTRKRWDSLQYIIEKQKKDKYGTVGCVAIDVHGDIVAGTSTGGMTNKRYGRVGGSSIIGAGTYANNKTCGISATGHGEFFIRYTVAHDISALMEYKELSLDEAANIVINEKLKPVNGSGGVIGIDKDLNVCMTFNTSGMYRGYATSRGDIEVLIFE
jgi:beta-aspartyl-peptidase (threonine type)